MSATKLTIYYEYEQRESIQRYGDPLRIEYMGCTNIKEEELNNYINQELRAKYSASNYDLATNNCNHFTEDLVKYLVNKTLPDYRGVAVKETKEGWGAWFASKISSIRLRI